MIKVKQSRFHSLDSFKILNQTIINKDSCDSSVGVGSSLSDLNTPSSISYNVLLTQRRNSQKFNKIGDSKSLERNFRASNQPTKSFTVQKHDENLSSTSSSLSNTNSRTNFEKDELRIYLVKPQITGNNVKTEEEISPIIMNNEEDKASCSSGSVSHLSVPASYCKIFLFNRN